MGHKTLARLLILSAAVVAGCSGGGASSADPAPAPAPVPTPPPPPSSPPPPPAVCTPTPLDLDAPLATATPPFQAVTHPRLPTGFWSSAAAPLPTNASWQNMVLGPGQDRVDFLPYQIKAVPEGLAVAQARPVNAVGTAVPEVTVPDLKQMVIGAYPGSFTGHSVVKHDLFSVTLQYNMAGGTMTAPLVQGMPYVSVRYAGIKPFLLPGADATGARSIQSINGSTASPVTGTRFQLALSDGTTWIVYTSASTTFNWTAGNMAAAAVLDGTLRLANAPTPADMAVLDAHAGAIPVGGTLDVSISCDVATLGVHFQTTGSGPLLMAAMPHHMRRLNAPVTTALRFGTLSGALVGVEGADWQMRLPLSTIAWQAPRAPTASHLEAVRSALAADAGFVPDSRVASDPYFGGKQLSKLARLALIADELGETSTAATLRARLGPLSAAWLTGSNSNPLRYDTTWGGVVSATGLANPSADFGQGYYNDHHFHYGYHLYAAAALARKDAAFAATHRAALLALVRDIANPSAADPRFPRFRHMDFFRSHSWATGITNISNGRDQESTSEAVNAWHAVYLLGLALGDTRMADIGRVLQALEVDGAQSYWQVTQPAIYPDPFAQYRVVGQLFQTKATFGTFFGSEAYKVYGIQLLPFTPASEALIAPAWVTEAWPTSALQGALSTAPAEWAGLLHMAHASVAREEAWTAAQALTAWDDGNSKTNTLWWIATRP